MIKMSAEARCPITFYEELDNMTKTEIIKELKMYGVDATLRARKSTLMALLVEKREDNMMDMNVVYAEEQFKAKMRPVTTEEWMEFTSVKPKDELNMLPGFLIFLFGVLIVYLWEDGVSFAEMAGTAWILFTLIGIPAIVWKWARA